MSKFYSCMIAVGMLVGVTAAHAFDDSGSVRPEKVPAYSARDKQVVDELESEFNELMKLKSEIIARLEEVESEILRNRQASRAVQVKYVDAQDYNTP